MSGIHHFLLGSVAGRVSVPLTISANTNNYDVYTNRGPTYVAGISDITVTVNPAVTVGSTTTPTYAMLVPSAFNPGDTVTIVNNGVIQGMGAVGGNGGSGTGAGTAGSVGGSTVYVNRPTIITNNGTVAAGGGGGGGGGGGRFAGTPKTPASNATGGGGGGGAGTNGGAGGAPNGSVGTSPAGGAGGAGGTSPGGGSGGVGGAGGGRGAVGVTGSGGGGPGGGGAGGAGGTAGNYIVGNPFVTWPVTGTREGNVA